MTDKLQPFSNCPHLGLSGDSGSVFMMATPSHCCFADEEPFSPDLEYQTQYCLTAHHTLCSLCQSRPDAGSRPAEGFGQANDAISQNSAQFGWGANEQEQRSWDQSAFAQSPQSETRSVFEPPSLDSATSLPSSEPSLDSSEIDDSDHTVVTRIPDFEEASVPMPFANDDSYSMGATGPSQPEPSWSSYQPSPGPSLIAPSQPVEMAQSKERVATWPLAMGALALTVLMGVYLYFQNGLPAFNFGTGTDVAAILPQVEPTEANDNQANPVDINLADNEQDIDESGARETIAETIAEVESSSNDDDTSSKAEVSNETSVGLSVVTATPIATATPEATPTETAEAEAVLSAAEPNANEQTSAPDSNRTSDSSLQAMNEPTSTPHEGGRIISIKPNLDNAGWWSSEDVDRNHLGDSFLYAGLFEGREYISAIRYDLRELARGADIYEATIQLTGLREDRFDATIGAAWRVELISEKEFSGFSRADFLTARSAVAAYQVNPTIGPEMLGVGETIEWELTAEMRAWLKQQVIDGARSFIVRIQADVYGGETLFAWDTGQGSQTQDEAPWLTMSVGRAPETPPPVSTRPFIVATSTPVPKNILTSVAVNQEATSVAQSIGTYTPVPYDIYTPTPYPENLATVQAVAIDRGLPPVALPTKPLASAEERAAAAQYATAVALTTGTFTPVPQNYVTPQLLLPSPIAQNVATTVARTAVAEVQALTQTPTPLPYNAIVAEYVVATTLPENSATEEARRVIAAAMAQTTGTATPLPWHIFVVTPTPTPLPTLPPTITPTPFLFNADGFQPTAEPQAPGTEVIPDVVPPQLRRKVIFRSDRVNGQVETLALDPNSGETFVVALDWAHDVARRGLGRSPDGQRGAVVANVNGEPIIRIVRYENNAAKPISGIEVPGYDVAWSPSGGLIAYVSNASGSDEIYVMSEDGSGQRPLTNTPSNEVKHPTWWNGQIIFHSNQTGRRQLWVMNTDGSNARLLAPSEANDFEPVYAP